MKGVRDPPSTPLDLKDWYNFPDPGPDSSDVAVCIVKMWDMDGIEGTYDRTFHTMLTGDVLDMFGVFSTDAMPRDGFSITRINMPLPAGRTGLGVKTHRITPEETGNENEITLDASVVAGIRPTRPIVILGGDRSVSMEELVEWVLKNPPLVPFMDYSLVDGRLTGVVRPNSTPRRVRWGAISVSIGNDEERDGAPAGNNSYAFALARAMGVTICASTGDFGRYGSEIPTSWVAWPASCRDVLAIGGTAVDGYGHEVGWSGGGWGDSKRVEKPPWQAFLPGTKRALPDVAAIAYGISIIWRGRTLTLNGTSISAPIWASLIANLDLRTFAAPLVYGIAASHKYPLAFRDVSPGQRDGGTTSREDQIIGNRKEWDYCTGLGVPDGVELARAIAGYTVDVTQVLITAPSTDVLIDIPQELSVTFTPSTATCKDVLWEIVGAKPGGVPNWIDPLGGRVWAQGACELNVRATTPNGSSDQVYIRVYPTRPGWAKHVTDVQFTPSIAEMTLEVGQRRDAPTYVVTPDNAFGVKINWVCRDPRIVECDPNTGQLLAVKAGSAAVELRVVSAANEEFVRGVLVNVKPKVETLLLMNPVYVLPLDLPVSLEVQSPGRAGPLSSQRWEVKPVQKNGQENVFGPTAPGISVSGGVVTASASGVWEVRVNSAGLTSNVIRIYTGVQPVSIELGPHHALRMSKGSSRTLFAVAQPYPCVAPLFWESPSTLDGGVPGSGSVVSMVVGSDGLSADVTAVETGTSMIWVRTADGLIRRSFVISVVSQPVPIPTSGRIEIPYTQFPDAKSLSFSKAWRKTNLMQATVVPDATDVVFEWDVLRGPAATIDRRSGLLTMRRDGESVVRCRSGLFSETITVSSQSDQYPVDAVKISRYLREVGMYAPTDRGLRGTVGDVFQLAADVNYPRGYDGLKENRVTWSVYPVSVAIIRRVRSGQEGSDCIVDALAPGSCTIRAISVAGTVCATATLRVFPPPEAVKISLPTKKLYAPIQTPFDGERFDASQPSKLKLNAIVSPPNAMDLSVSWSSSDNEVAFIHSTGYVLAKNPGRCKLTATSSSFPDVSSQVDLTVEPVLCKAIDDPPDMTFELLGGLAGRSPIVGTLPKPAFTPSNTRDQRVTWVLERISGAEQSLRAPVTLTTGGVGGLLVPVGLSILRNTQCVYRCTGTSVDGSLKSCSFKIIIGVQEL